MDELLRDFLAESAEQLEAVKAQLSRVDFDFVDPRASDGAWRWIHAIKGACGFLNLPRLEAIAHAAEALVGSMNDEVARKRTAVSLILEAVDRMSFLLEGLVEGRSEPIGDDSALIARMEAAAGPSPASWRGVCDGDPLLETPLDGALTPPERRKDAIRVPLKSIERIDSLVSDLIVTHNQILAVARSEALDSLRTPLRRLSMITGDLQSEALAARVQPIGRLFAKLHRLAHDVAADLGRQVHLSLEGGEVLLGRQLFGSVREALALLVRDAIDYGIEPPDDRRRLGKPDAGQITISARTQVDQAVIEVRDDGRGIDADKPASSSRSNRRDDGVRIVRAALEDIGGSVALEGRPGEGATTTLRIPLAIAAVSAVIVEAGADRFAAELRIVDDLVTLDSNGDARLEAAPDGLFLWVKGDRTPAARLSVLMQSPTPSETPDGLPVGLLMRAGDRRFAIVVDAVSGVQDLVLKALPQPMRHTKLFSGAAILKDGSGALVLSPSGLAEALGATAWRSDAADPGPGHRLSDMTSVAPKVEAADGRLTRLLVIEPAMPLRRMPDADASGLRGPVRRDFGRGVRRASAVDRI